MAAVAILASASASGQQAPALADSVASEARRLFEQGLHQLDAADFAAAVASFEASVALRRSPAALYNLGLALRGQHAYRRAREVFEQLVELLGSEANDPVCSAARTIGAEMQQQVARVHLTVRGGSELVLIDGARTPTNDGVRDVDFDPGRHVFEVQRRGHATQRFERTLGAGEHTAMQIDAAAAPLQARLRVETNQPNADIWIDGVSRASGVFEGGLEPTTHRLQARIGGRVVWQRGTALEPGGGMRISLRLPAAHNRVLGSPWFWIGAGGLLVSTVIGVVIAGISDTPPSPYCGLWNICNVADPVR